MPHKGSYENGTFFEANIFATASILGSLFDLVEVTHIDIFFCQSIFSTATNLGSLIFIELDDDRLAVRLVVDPELRFFTCEDATRIGLDRITAECVVALALFRINYYGIQLGKRF